MAQMAKEVMDSIADVPRYPEPPNHLPSKKNSVEKFLLIQKESEGGTTCSPCTKVPAVVTDFYVEQRDQFLEKNTAAAKVLHDSLHDYSNESSPSSSQNSNSKRARAEDTRQPSITQALVSFFVHLEL